MRFDFSDSEIQLLKATLNLRLTQMRYELMRTDDRHYRAELRTDLERLEGILTHIEKYVFGSEKKSA